MVLFVLSDRLQLTRFFLRCITSVMNMWSTLWTRSAVAMFAKVSQSITLSLIFVRNVACARRSALSDVLQVLSVKKHLLLIQQNASSAVLVSRTVSSRLLSRNNSSDRNYPVISKRSVKQSEYGECYHRWGFSIR